MTAISVADFAHASRSNFRRRVDAALTAIDTAAGIGPIGVAFSAGKDSTVLLDLVRHIQPDVPVAHYDSGAEYQWTYDLADHYSVESIKPQKSVIELAKIAGDWGYRGPEWTGQQIDYDEFLIYEPARRFNAEHDLQVIALGLRGQESKGRLWSARRNGPLFFAKTEGMWHLCPLAEWTTEDVWAYIASRGLRYNEAYDKMTAIGIPRDAQRVSTLLSYEGAAKQGRFSALRQIAPEQFYDLAETFPFLCQYT